MLVQTRKKIRTQLWAWKNSCKGRIAQPHQISDEPSLKKCIHNHIWQLALIDDACEFTIYILKLLKKTLIQTRKDQREGQDWFKQADILYSEWNAGTETPKLQNPQGGHTNDNKSLIWNRSLVMHVSQGYEI